MKYKDYLLRTFAIAWPCIVENIMVSISNYADSIMVSRLGTEATAAVGINTTITWLINAMATGLAVGGTVLVANHIGAGRKQDANEATLQTLNLTLVLTSVICILMVLLSGTIPQWMGAEPEIMADAVSYLRIYSYSIFAHFCGIVISGLLRGAGNTKTPMYIRIVANILNIIGNFILIYEPWTLRIFSLEINIWGAGLGVAGSAISTSVTNILAGVILALMLLDKNQILYINIKRLFHFNGTIIKKILLIGLPAAGERVFVAMGQVFFQRIIASLGTVAVAANYMANTAESISYMPANGLSVSSTTLVGQSLGAKNEEDTKIYSKIHLWLAVIVGIISAIGLLAFPEYLIMLFSKEPEVIRLGSQALRTMALVEICFNLNVVIIGILRAAGDTKMPLIASFVGMWGIRLISAWFFAHYLGWGLTGAWVGMALDNIIRTIILGYRYLKKKWLTQGLELDA